jgi:hypothetical protein
MAVDLDQLSREELIQRARELGAERPEVMTRVELRDEIVRLSEPDPAVRRRSRGWLGVARDLVASVVDAGLNMPGAAKAIRGDARPAEETTGPPPVATLTLAEIYLAQGHVERALAVLDEVLVTEPEHTLAVELRDRILKERESGAFRRRPALEPEEFDDVRPSAPAPAPFTPSSPPPYAMREPPRMPDLAPPASAEVTPTAAPEVDARPPYPKPRPLIDSGALDASQVPSFGAETPSPDAVAVPPLLVVDAPAAETAAVPPVGAVEPPPTEAAPSPPHVVIEAAGAEAAVTASPFGGLEPPPLDAGAGEPFAEPPHEPDAPPSVVSVVVPEAVAEFAPAPELEPPVVEPPPDAVAFAHTDVAAEAAPVVPRAELAFDLTTEGEGEPQLHFPPEFQTEPGVPPARTSALTLESTPPSAPTPTLAAPSPRTLAIEPGIGAVCALVQRGTEIVAHHRVLVSAGNLLLRVVWFVPGRSGPTEGSFDVSLDPGADRVVLPPVDASAHVRGALGEELDGAFKPLAVAWVYRVSEGGVSVAFAPPGAPPFALRAQLGRDVADLLV